MVKIAMDMLRQGMIDEKTALLRLDPNKLDELLHPVFDKDALKQAKVIAKGLAASPGGSHGTHRVQRRRCRRMGQER